MKRVFPLTIQNGMSQSGSYILMLCEPQSGIQVPSPTDSTPAPSTAAPPTPSPWLSSPTAPSSWTITSSKKQVSQCKTQIKIPKTPTPYNNWKNNSAAAKNPRNMNVPPKYNNRSKT